MADVWRVPIGNTDNIIISRIHVCSMHVVIHNYSVYTYLSNFSIYSSMLARGTFIATFALLLACSAAVRTSSSLYPEDSSLSKLSFSEFYNNLCINRLLILK